MADKKISCRLVLPMKSAEKDINVNANGHDWFTKNIAELGELVLFAIIQKYVESRGPGNDAA